MPNKFYFNAFTENATTDMMILFAWYWFVCWIQYPTYGSMSAITYVWDALVFCVCGSSNHKSRTLKNTDRPW